VAKWGHGYQKSLNLCRNGHSPRTCVLPSKILQNRMPSKKPHIASTYHSAYLEVMAQQTEPANLLARIIVKKLDRQGIDGAKHLDAIKESVREILASDSQVNASGLEFKFDDGNTNEVAIQVDGDDVDKTGQEILDGIDTLADKVFESLTKSALESVFADPSRRLLHLANERDAFVRRLEHTWTEAFMLLDIHVAICQEIGAARNDWLRTKRRRSKDLVVVDVITRLHGRAVSIAGEVQVLLRNGFADGALSRWRTIHELAVTAMFIAEHGEEVAERYVAHFAADSIKAARQYQNFATVLGYRPISPREQKRLEKEAQRLAQKFGKPFLNDYGWASDVLQNSHPTFTSIEAAVDLDRLRPYFRPPRYTQVRPSPLPA
jgi:hypothetical protein